jgi:putative FmdB family regulatory protein
MPTYDYRCRVCDHLFEAQHSMTAPAPVCPACQANDVKRVIKRVPAIAGGMNTHAGDGRRASKEQLKSKWAEETPKLRKQLEDKLGADTVRKNAPSLYNNSE